MMGKSNLKKKLIVDSFDLVSPRLGLNLSNQVYEALKQKIFEFVWLPGAMLFENQLSEQFSVSRTPLRQALQRLEHEGLVLSLPKVGWQVAQIDFVLLDQLYDFRILIESYAVEVLCKLNQPFSLLEPLCKDWLVPKSKRLSEPKAVGALDEEFHSALVRAVGNGQMSKTHHDITQRIRMIRRLDFTKPTRIDDTYEEHGLILNTILLRRRTEAVMLIKTHIEQSKIEVRKITLSVLYESKVCAV
jgi:DNA-binding GntR family transcriptional regulator